MKALIIWLGLLISISITTPSYGNEIYRCIQLAANTYSIPASLIEAVAYAESRIGKNTNHPGNDFGIMGINEWWFPILKKRFDINANQVKHDDCTNIMVGSWIMQNNIIRFGDNWYAIGVYNAGTKNDPVIELKRKKYANTIHNYIATNF